MVKKSTMSPEGAWIIEEESLANGKAAEVFGLMHVESWCSAAVVQRLLAGRVVVKCCGGPGFFE